MTTNEENRFGMYLTFKDFQAGYTAITNRLPNYSNNSAIFLDTIPQIQEYSQLQKTNKKGVVLGKNQLKESLIVMTADYFRKLGTYARFANNLTLIEEVKISEYKLRRMSDTSLIDYAHIVYNRAQAHLNSLETYGITAEKQSMLLGAISAYNDSIGKPGLSRIEAGQTTKQLKELFKTADAALSNLDAAVEVIRLTEPNFYEAYHKARKVHRRINSMAVKARAVEEITDEPLKGVLFSFSLDGHEDKVKGNNIKYDLVKKTAAKGKFHIKTLLPGIYNVNIKKSGYVEQDVVFNVVDGQANELHIKMSKILK